MLIFDNILFASFIPQILMFLGFISCMTAPYFSSPKEELHEPELNEQVIIFQKTESSNKTAFFGDFSKYDREYSEIPVKTAVFIPWIMVRKEFALFFTESTGYRYAFLTRPPPIHSLNYL